MDDEQAAMMQELSETMQGLRSLVSHPEFLRGRGASSASNISINAGGVGLWISVTCCIVMFVIVAIGGFFYVEQMIKVDKMQDYLNAIYQQAPQLKPKGENL